MAERRLAGTPAAPGAAAAPALVLDVSAETLSRAVPSADRDAEASRAVAALETAAMDIDLLAERLRATAPQDAEIIETGALMARDPALAAAVAAATSRGLSAPAAILEAAGSHAHVIASLPDATLAARADDVRSIGRRAARLAAASPSASATSPSTNGIGEREAATAPAPSPEGAVLVALDLGPADVAEHAGSVAGIALAAGGVAAHAAIVARSLGIPMVVGLGDAVLEARDGAVVAVDGTEGVAVLDPAPALVDEFAPRRRDAPAPGPTRAPRATFPP